MILKLKIVHLFVLIYVASYCFCRRLSSQQSHQLKARTYLCKRLRISKLPDNKFCHRYYSCRNPWLTRECKYPKLYSKLTRSCEHYSKVNCISRFEPKSPCQYRGYNCRSSHCIPCSVRYPSCQDLRNGINPHIIKKNSPYFMECRNGRLVREGRCSLFKRHKLRFPLSKEERYCLDPFGNRCTIGGKRRNGIYPTSGCTLFMRCFRGRKFTFRCPRGTVYDTAFKRCRHVRSVCKPCGTKKC